MGDVMLVYKIMPQDPEEDLQRIKDSAEKIAKEHGKFKGNNEEKIAFGLKAVMTKVVIPDEGGIIDNLEEELRGIDGIQSVEAEDMTLI